MRPWLVPALAFGLGLLAGLLVAPRETTRARSRGVAEPTAEVLRLAAEAESLRDENRALTKALEEARSERAPPSEPGRTAAVIDGPAPLPARPRRGPALTFPAYEAALAAGDWTATGSSLAKLMPLLAEAGEVAHGRKPMRAALWGEILEGLGPVITLAMELETAGVAWSSPSVLVNLVSATLAEAGQPLDERQLAELHALALRSIEEDERRRAGYGEATLAFRKRVELVRQSDRLYAAIDPLLTAAQRAVLWPPGVRGVVALDVFSGSGNWDEHIEALPHAGLESLSEQAFAVLAREGGLRPALGPVLRPWLDDWQKGLPAPVVATPPAGPAAGDVKMERAEVVLQVATQQLALLERLLASAPLEDPERARLRALDRLYVPARRP
ncbi:MAG: hypothetical protein ACT4PV_15275 [Planctomycetaceae bacterium]